MKYLCALCLVFLGLSLAACSNTFHGAGQDLERAGEKIQETFE